VTISGLLDQTDLQKEGKAEGLTLRAAMRAVSTSLAAAISSSSNLDGSPYSINTTLPCPKTQPLHRHRTLECLLLQLLHTSGKVGVDSTSMLYPSCVIKLPIRAKKQ